MDYSYFKLFGTHSKGNKKNKCSKAIQRNPYPEKNKIKQANKQTKNQKVHGGVRYSGAYIPLIPAHGKQRQADLC